MHFFYSFVLRLVNYFLLPVFSATTENTVSLPFQELGLIFDAHTKRQITKRQTHKTTYTQNSIKHNSKRTQRQMHTNGRRHKTAEGTKRQKAQNGRRHKTAEGTERKKAQNGRRHRTAEGTERQTPKTADAQNGRRHQTADGTKRQTIFTYFSAVLYVHLIFIPLLRYANMLFTLNAPFCGHFASLCTY
jgi:hypothetical protein